MKTHDLQNGLHTSIDPVIETLMARPNAADVAKSSTSSFVIADVTQPDMPLIHANKAFLHMTGYTMDEIKGQNCRFLQGDDTRQPALDILRNALRHGSSCSVVLRNYTKAGTFFWNDFSLIPMRDGQGKPKYFAGLQNRLTQESYEKLVSSGQAQPRYTDVWNHSQMYPHVVQEITVFLSHLHQQRGKDIAIL